MAYPGPGISHFWRLYDSHSYELLSPYSSVPKISLTDLNPMTLWFWAHLDGTLLSTTNTENRIHMFPSTLISNLCLAIL